MSLPPSPRSPLASLVLFMLCLSLAASLVAGLHYIAVDYPAQLDALSTPHNGSSGGNSCIQQCRERYAIGPVNSIWTGLNPLTLGCFVSCGF